MDSRRRVNSDVMPLIVLTKRTIAFIALLLLFGACHKTRIPSLPIRVSICDLYENPTAYNGKLISVEATVSWSQDAHYIYPGPRHNECGYSFIKVDADETQSNVLAAVDPPRVPIQDRKEVDLELIGTFDSNYSAPSDHFRYRIIAAEIKPQSPVRFGIRFGGG